MTFLLPQVVLNLWQRMLQREDGNLRHLCVVVGRSEQGVVQRVGLCVHDEGVRLSARWKISLHALERLDQTMVNTQNSQQCIHARYFRADWNKHAYMYRQCTCTCTKNFDNNLNFQFNPWKTCTNQIHISLGKASGRIFRCCPKRSSCRGVPISDAGCQVRLRARSGRAADRKTSTWTFTRTWRSTCTCTRTCRPTCTCTYIYDNACTIGLYKCYTCTLIKPSLHQQFYCRKLE